MAVPRRGIALVIVTAIGCGAFGVLWMGAQLSRPVPQRVGAAPPELDAVPVEIASDSGATIHGWLSVSGHQRGAVLLLPPVRANRRAMLPRATFLAASGYTTLSIDLQGTGESAGEAITFGWRERLDVIAAVKFLNERSRGEPVGIIGSSLGGAAALLATPPLNVQALVLEAVYPSIARAIENRLRIRIGGAAPFAAPLLLWQLKPRLGVTADQLRPVDHIGKVRCPVLVIGGVEDRRTTEADTRMLFDAAVEPKQLWLIPGAAHVDFYDAAGAEYRRTILAFLERAFAAPKRSAHPLSSGDQYSWRAINSHPLLATAELSFHSRMSRSRSIQRASK